MKQKFPRTVALNVARQLGCELKTFCERIAVGGSLRRGKMEVGDIELLYIPNYTVAPADDFFTGGGKRNAADEKLEMLISAGVIAKRKNVNGHESWGDKIKLAVHVATGVPVDFFSTNQASWFNYLVCRIGPAESNIRVAMAAKAKGWKWEPYRAGFLDQEGQVVLVTCQEDVFRLVGLPYLEPRQRI